MVIGGHRWSLSKYLLKSTKIAGPLLGRVTSRSRTTRCARKALSCTGYSRSDFVVSDKGPTYLEINTLPGLTKASLYPKALKAAGHRLRQFLKDQIVLAAAPHP